MEGFGPYLLMAASAFLAATLLPWPSETVLAAQLLAGKADVVPLVGVATVANTAGSLVNWWLGRQLPRLAGLRWFPFDARDIETARQRFARWGKWSLLLAWVPVIGDPLTLIAGVLRVPLRWFLPLVALGKGLRYGVVAWPLAG